MAEGGTIAAPAAVVNAIVDALETLRQGIGESVTTYPLTPQPDRRAGARGGSGESPAALGAEREPMKPARFRYVAPLQMEEVVHALSEHGDDCKLLAGGQSLVPLMNMRLAQPALVVDLNRVQALQYVRREDGVVAIGAMTRQRVLEHDASVRELIPVLVDALRWVGHPQIRNRGTIGGSLAHADPAAELPAIAVLLDAELVVEGPARQRTIPAADFFVTYLTTALEPDELLREIRLPAQPIRAGSAVLEVARRHGDFALAGAAALVTLDGGTITDGRLALFGVADRPVRLPEVEALLRGRPPIPSTFAEARIAVMDHVRPESDIHASGEYRRQAVGVLAQRALQAAAQSGAGEQHG